MLTVGRCYRVRWTCQIYAGTDPAIRDQFGALEAGTNVLLLEANEGDDWAQYRVMAADKCGWIFGKVLDEVAP